MPVVTINTCTEEAVLEALRSCEGGASYETDNNEALGEVLGFDRCQVNTLFHHLRQLCKAGLVQYTRCVVEPTRMHTRGSRPAIVRRVTYRVIE